MIRRKQEEMMANDEKKLTLKKEIQQIKEEFEKKKKINDLTLNDEVRVFRKDMK